MKMKVLVLGAGADSPGGAEVLLLDSNPATLATDADVAHRTYLEPLTIETVARIGRDARW